MRPYLSSPGKIGALTVKNRVIMEAMGNALSNLDGSMSAEDIAFYEARAKGGAGLIMSEAVSVSSNSGRANPRNLCIDDAGLIPWLPPARGCPAPYGCAFFVELYHPGRQGTGQLNGRRMFALSAIQCGLTRQPVISHDYRGDRLHGAVVHQWRHPLSGKPAWMGCSSTPRPRLPHQPVFEPLHQPPHRLLKGGPY